MSFDDDAGSLIIDMFQDPAGYLPPEPAATYEVHTLLSGQTIRLRLVGHNPLWGHHLWNGAQVISKYLQNNAKTLIHHKNVLELGAGAGLPSLVAAILGARRVVVTDYPDADLISNLKHNIGSCVALSDPTSVIAAHGYLWGQPADSLISGLCGSSSLSGMEECPGFDLLILADLLFNHSEHAALLATVSSTLKRSPRSKALVFFTPYRPWLLEKDVAFFELALKGGFTVEKICEEVMEKVMFKEDPGDELLRRTVFGYQLGWAGESLKIR